jgi:hypothetical protein
MLRYAFLALILAVASMHECHGFTVSRPGMPLQSICLSSRRGAICQERTARTSLLSLKASSDDVQQKAEDGESKKGGLVSAASFNGHRNPLSAYECSRKFPLQSSCDNYEHHNSSSHAINFVRIAFTIRRWNM